ncbi:MAG: sugar phosphate nucleotidyltransferase [Candidatus Hydrogenedentes bacterium]|nr:sugar phosphate nucleotidyltransferase [Candidatus Hydrogenedentota bacterium]
MPTVVCLESSPYGGLPVAPAGPSRWTVVLSGGEGRRMRPLISRWLGVSRPKQYCTFSGTRSMLQHTLDRAAMISEPERTIVVIGSGHRGFFESALSGEFGGMVMEQPSDCGTAAGVLLPVNYILQQDPDATVVVLPSDHFVYPESSFVDQLDEAASMAEFWTRHLILLGAVPDRPETDYGWIEPSTRKRSPGRELRGVLNFYEKPCKAEAERFYRHQWLWNTMIVAAKAQALWSLGGQLLGELTARLESVSAVMRAVAQDRVDASHLDVALAHVYRDLPCSDFSRHILQRAPESSAVVPMAGIEWCDWGRPERISATLAALGAEPAFPMHALEGAASTA